MKILLIMPLSYGYYKEIMNIFVNRGDDVSFIPDFDESYFKRIIRKIKSIDFLQNKYIQNAINKLANADFDVILLIRGYFYSASTIKWIKEKYHNSKFVMYQWDPLSVSKFDLNALGLCDSLFSFDRNDCIKFGMIYLPLFFSKLPPSYGNRDNSNNTYDFSFIGSGHSQRLFVIGNLIKELREKGYTYYIRIYINRFEYLKGLILNLPGFRSFPKECLSFKPIPKSIANDIVQQSKVVIDVHHPKQTGLSIRVMEVLGAGINIITTNKSILDEPFYTPDSIGIIEKCRLPSNINRLLSNREAIDVSSYEIGNWINILVPATT